jgi:DNA (cytosine-5)-methyltransferase 1
MHLFAGAGGGLLADLILGHTPIVAVEWDKYACRVLRERAAEGWFPDLHVYEGDIRLFDPSEYAGRVDCIHAGFPCQDISTAGKRAGVGEGTRSNLYTEAIRIFRAVRPKYLFLENVSAILSRGMLATIMGDLAEVGFDEVQWTCLRASEVGASHHRNRWWCLAYSKEFGLQGCDKAFGELSSESGKWTSHLTGDDTIVADANKTRWSATKDFEKLEGKRPCVKSNTKRGREGGNSTASWWEAESNVGRVVDGLASRVDRLRCIGNGQVPLQAAVAWKILGGP